MSKEEYDSIQYALNRLINEEHRMRFLGLPKYWDTHKQAVLACKSVLGNYNPNKGERR